MTDLSREEALRSWRQGRSPEALGELLKAQRDRAYSTAVRLTGSPADAEDVVQEAFIKLMSREKGFEDPGQFDLSVYRAVLQCALDSLRRGRRREAREAKVGREVARMTAAAQETQPGIPEQELPELRAALRQAVEDLPDEERTPAVLCYYQGLSESQAAQVMEIPRSTLRRRLSRAVSALRSRLGSKESRLSAAMLAALMTGEPPIPAPASLCAALDQVLPGKACALIPALPASGGTAAVPAAAVGVKIAVAALAAACAGLLALWLHAAGPDGRRSPAASQRAGQEITSHPDRVNVRPGGGDQEVAARPGRGEEEEARVMDGKLKGLAALAGGLVLSGVAGAAEPNADVAAVIAKIQARQTAKAEAAAADATDRAKLYKEYGERMPGAGGGRYGQ
jgi:RNA polymerase sigma-70 factor (ECF subfamily)